MAENQQARRADVIDLVQLAKALRKKLWLIILVALALGTLTFLGTKIFITPTYRSSFTAYINNKSGDENKTLTNSDLLAAQSLVNTYSAILVSEPVLADAAETAGLDMSYRELSRAVTTGTVSDTEIIQVNVTLENPENAKILADALAEIAPDYISKIVEGSAMQVIAPARLPDSIYSPNYLRNTAIGFLLGALLVMAAIVVKELLDNRVKSEGELEARYGIVVMGTIPDLVESKKKNIAAYKYQ